MSTPVKSQPIERFKMTSYDHVSEMAGFTFINHENKTRTIQISRMMFKHVMSDEQWNQKRFGQMPAVQFEMKACMKTYGKGIVSWSDWFDQEANSITRERM